MKYKIYEEGADCMEGRWLASYIGEAEGDTFIEACKNFINTTCKEGEIRTNFDGSLYACRYGCRWYPTLKEARKIFG